MRHVATIACVGVLLVAVTASAAPGKSTPTRRASTMRVTATAYCDKGTTKSGARARTGILAADPRVLPVGSVVRIVAGAAPGIYTVMDTGAAVKGPKIDIFIPNCIRAEKFGEKQVQLRVLRRGWDPKATAGDK